MGRQGPRLVPFLENGLSNRKYRNLISEDPLGRIFSIVLPHKTKKLDVKDELIFKDWYALNGKKYIFASKHYTDARQALTASLRKSDYVDKVHISDNRLTYRILDKAEVKEKKRLKKELKNKKEMKKGASDTDDALSSVESGYGSGGDSPRNDYGLMSLNDNFLNLGGNESPQAFFAMQTSSLLEINDAKRSRCSGKFEGFLKAEPMDASISAEKSLVVPDTPILFESDFLTKFQPFADNLKSADYFPENTESLYHSLDLMECTFENPELNSSSLIEDLPAENEAVNEYDFLQLDGLSSEDLNNLLLKDVSTFNFNPSLAYEESINNHISETQNMPELPTDKLTEDLFKLLEEEFSAVDSHPSVAVEENSQEQISSSVDAGSPDHETGEREKIFLCKKCIHLGKIPILLCEPQFETSITEKSSEIKIAFEETVLKEINGFKSVKEFKFINDHLMVILEPNDD